MKKFSAILLALILVLAMCVPAFAAETKPGTITINSAETGHTYSVYKIFDLESYDPEAKAYSYTITGQSPWYNFVKAGEGAAFVNIDAQGYVTVKTDTTMSAADFAKKALEYAKTNSIQPTKTATANSDSVVLNDLDLGYYLVDSTLGALCGLTTTQPAATIAEKNAEPTNEKKVKEDSTNAMDSKNDADIGQEVEFESTITAQEGAQNYVFHDTMSTGLDFVENSVTVTLNGNTVVDTNYTVTPNATHGEGENAKTCTFDVTFIPAFCDTLKDNDKIVISYKAVVTDDAVIGGEGNPNESKLTYGENGGFETEPSQTKTYTWEFDVLKYAMENGVEQPLQGAEFILYKKVNNANQYATIVNGKITGWTTEEASATTLTSDADGKIAIDGLDSDTYYLTETKAPTGYNKLAADVEVKIDEDGKVYVKDASGNEVEVANKTVKVENKTGTELPSTGGMGTTLFYAVGGLLVFAAIVLLITKKRMSMGE